MSDEAAVVTRSKQGPDGEEARAEDVAALTAAVDARADALERQQRAAIAVAQAHADFNELNRRLIKRYKLGANDVITLDGRIRRDVPAAELAAARAPVS